jgi:phosphoglycerate dehydrogenase-like enzyme
MRLTIWCDQKFDGPAEERLTQGTASHRLVRPKALRNTSSLQPAGAPEVDSADIIFGQPPPEAALQLPGLRWIHVSSAGYTRYDTPEFRDRLRAKGAVLSTSSAVFADPCAQHVLAMILAVGRQLLPSHRDQIIDHSWHYTERRYQSSLLTGQTVLLLGFGSIARRLVEFLTPFGCKIYALRRQARSERGVHVIGTEDLTRVLPLADHVVNLMPENEATRGWVNARRLACLRPSARFYNVGRGATVDQAALIEALTAKKLGAAYLDVTEPEPLPPEHPLWTTPNCYITPHTAGGRRDQDLAVVEHFLRSLAPFVANLGIPGIIPGVVTPTVEP